MYNGLTGRAPAPAPASWTATSWPENRMPATLSGLVLANVTDDIKLSTIFFLDARPGTCRVQSCRTCRDVQDLKRPRAAVPVVGFYPCCRHAVSTSTSLGIHWPAAGAVQPAVNDWSEGVTDRWRSVWNGLPSDVTSAPSLAVFGRWLNTELFRRCYTMLLDCRPFLLYSGPWNWFSI